MYVKFWVINIIRQILHSNIHGQFDFQWIRFHIPLGAKVYNSTDIIQKEFYPMYILRTKHKADKESLQIEHDFSFDFVKTYRNHKKGRTIDFYCLQGNLFIITQGCRFKGFPKSKLLPKKKLNYFSLEQSVGQPALYRRFRQQPTGTLKIGQTKYFTK